MPKVIRSKLSYIIILCCDINWIVRSRRDYALKHINETFQIKCIIYIIITTVQHMLYLWYRWKKHLSSTRYRTYWLMDHGFAEGLAQQKWCSVPMFLLVGKRLQRWASSKTALGYFVAYQHLDLASAHVDQHQAVNKLGLHPSKHETFTQWRYNVGPASQTLTRHCTGIWVNVSCFWDHVHKSRQYSFNLLVLCW